MRSEGLDPRRTAGLWWSRWEPGSQGRDSRGSRTRDQSLSAQTLARCAAQPVQQTGDSGPASVGEVLARSGADGPRGRDVCGYIPSLRLWLSCRQLKSWSRAVELPAHRAKLL